MLKPRKVRFWAQKKEKENIEFRTFLKINADEDELDQQFLQLHNELFTDYDCNKCRNCCKQYAGNIPEADIEKDAEYINISTEKFKHKYLKQADLEGMYQTIHIPCDFLNDDGTCRLEDCKPESCKKYPYTNQPERLQSLYSVLETVSVCPVAFEILERLKEEYNFQHRG
jgi:Fe-S-cluster containining protein